jgi:hypothetical protein
MTPKDREDFYDREVAPALLDLASRCEVRGMSIIAVVEWQPGDTGRTAALAAEASFALRLVELASQAHGNVDNLIMALTKYGKKHGHASICLKQLGVEPTS